MTHARTAGQCRCALRSGGAIDPGRDPPTRAAAGQRTRLRAHLVGGDRRDTSETCVFLHQPGAGRLVIPRRPVAPSGEDVLGDARPRDAMPKGLGITGVRFAGGGRRAPLGEAASGARREPRSPGPFMDSRCESAERARDLATRSAARRRRRSASQARPPAVTPDEHRLIIAPHAVEVGPHARAGSHASVERILTRRPEPVVRSAGECGRARLPPGRAPRNQSPR